MVNKSKHMQTMDENTAARENRICNDCIIKRTGSDGFRTSHEL